MKTLILVCLSIAALFLPFAGTAQDVIFSQFYANPLYLNPALAGNKLDNRITVNYRNQWPAANKGYVTYNATWDKMVDRISGGVGILVNADRMGNGAYSRFNVSGVYSYRLQVAKYVVVNAALQAGYFQHTLQVDKLVFGDQINPYTGSIGATAENISRRNIGNVDFSAGLLGGYKESFYFGLAVNHLNRPNIAFVDGNPDRQQLRWTAHSGVIIDFFQGMMGEDVRNFSISPNVVYVQQWKFRQLNAGVTVNMFPFAMGLWFRNNFKQPDAIMLQLGLVHKDYKIGYSFDYTISRLTMRPGGAHEVSIAWMFRKHLDPDRFHDMRGGFLF